MRPPIFTESLPMKIIWLSLEQTEPFAIPKMEKTGPNHLLLSLKICRESHLRMTFTSLSEFEETSSLQQMAKHGPKPKVEFPTISTKLRISAMIRKSGSPSEMAVLSLLRKMV